MGIQGKKADIEREDLYRMHEVEEMSQSDIADYYNVSSGTVNRYIHLYGIKARTISEAKILNAIHKPRCNAKYRVNQNFFKTWTPESAWLYGWALGDGGYTTPRSFRFGVSIIDKEVLYKFQTLLESDHPITDYSTLDKRTRKEHAASMINFCSAEITRDLKRLSYMDVPIDFFDSFVRGFFEAEGGVYANKRNNRSKGWSLISIFSQSDKKMLEYIHRRLREMGAVKGGSLYVKKDGVCQLTFSVKDTIALYHFMYDNSDFMFLQRKKDTFEELIGRQLNG